MIVMYQINYVYTRAFLITQRELEAIVKSYTNVNSATTLESISLDIEWSAHGIVYQKTSYQHRPLIVLKGG